MSGVERCGGVGGPLAAEETRDRSTSKVWAISSSATINALKGRDQRGVEGSAQRASVLAGGGGGWMWPAEVGVRTSGPCESSTRSTDL